MADKHVKGIINAVEQSDVYADALAAVPADEQANVKATVEGFATMLGPVIEALEKLEQSEEVAQAVRARLAEKLRAR
jgi:hypothetical protein